MKKRNIVMICLAFALILFTTTVNAANEPCKISLSADKTTLAPGDTVTLNLTISNVTKTNGISQFYGVLDFSDDIFEVVPDDDESIIADYSDYEGYTVLYSGRQDDSALNPWYIVYVEEEGQKGIIASVDTEYSNTVQAVKSGSSQVVGKIKLKVKDSATGTVAKIALTDMEAFEESSDSSTDGDTEDTAVSDTSVSFTLEGGTEEPTQIQTRTENKTQNKIENDNKSNNNVPYTGIEDTIPVIFILAIIAILAYINYRKYKNI